MATYTAAPVGGNWNVASTWGGLGVPTTGDIVLFNQLSGPVTVTSGARCSELNFNSGTGYANTITFANELLIEATSGFATSGNITLSNAVGFTMVGPNGINWNSTGNLSRTFTSFSIPFNLPLRSSGNGGNTITLVGDFTVSNLTFQLNILNGSNLIINGNVITGTNIGSGTSSCVLAGATTTWNTGTTLNRVIFNSSGTITISGSVNCNTSITWTSGTLVTTGSTVTMFNATSISLAGKTLNNFSFTYSAILTCTVTGDFNLTGFINLAGGGSTLNGTGKCFVTGNVTGVGGGGTFTIEMTGSSTFNGPTFNNIIINTTGTVTIGPTNDFGGNLTLTAGTLNLANNLTKRGSNFIIATGFLFTGSGNLLFRDVVFSNTTCTITTNGVSFPNSVQILPQTSVSNTLILNDNFTVLGSFSCLVGGSNQTQTINGNSLFVRGNFTTTTTGGVVGTTTIVFEGTSNMTWSQVGQMQNNITINKPTANVSISGTFPWGAAGRTLNIIAGNILPGSSVISIPNSTSVTINGMTFWNLTIGTSVTITQGALNTIQNNLTLNGNAIFTGAAGWVANNFTIGIAGTVCTLQASVTYIVNGLFTMIGSALLRSRLQSNDFANVTVSIPASPSLLMTVNTGSIPNPAAGYVLGSIAFATPLNTVLSDLLPNRPTIASGAASPYTLEAPIGLTPLTSYAGQVGKKAFFKVTNGTGSTNVIYAETRDIDSNGGITIFAGQSFPDNTATPNLFRTLNWVPLIAPSGSIYYTFVS